MAEDAVGHRRGGVIVVHASAGAANILGIGVSSCDRKAVEQGGGVKIGSFGMVENMIAVVGIIIRCSDITAQDGLICLNITLIKCCFITGKAPVD